MVDIFITDLKKILNYTSGQILIVLHDACYSLKNQKNKMHITDFTFFEHNIHFSQNSAHTNYLKRVNPILKFSKTLNIFPSFKINISMRFTLPVV